MNPGSILNRPQARIQQHPSQEALYIVYLARGGVDLGSFRSAFDIVLRRLFEYKDQDHIRIDPESTPKRSDSIQTEALYIIYLARGGVDPRSF